MFEWTGHTNVVPRWISVEDLTRQGFPVHTSYLPQVPREKLEEGESISNLYARSTETSRQILRQYESNGSYY